MKKKGKYSMITEAFLNHSDFETHKRYPQQTIRLINARHAEQGKEYYCPFCGAPMFLKHSVNNTAFYARKPGALHTQKICETISSKKVVCEFDIEGFDPKKYLKNLIPDAEPEENPPTGTGGLPKPPVPGGQLKPPVEDQTIPVAPAKAIRDLIDLGYERIDADQIINHQHGTRVKDLIFSVPSHPEFFLNMQMLDDTDRIVEMRPCLVYDRDQNIVCRAFRPIGNERYEYIYFYLHFSSKSEFGRAVEKIFTKVEENGRSRTKSKYDSIFVCAHWKLSDSYHEYNDEKSPRFDAAIKRMSSQIYCPSHYRKG